MAVRAWAHAIVRRYPQAWRDRYEAEVRGLIDDTPVRFHDLGELLRGLFTERARELLMSDEHPGRSATLLWLAGPILGALFVGAIWVTAIGLLKLTGPWPDLVQSLALVAFISLAVVGFVMVIRGGKRRDPSRPFIVPPDVAVRLLPLIFLGGLLYAAIQAQAEPSPPHDLPSWLTNGGTNWLWFAIFAGNQIASFFPGHELLQAFATISGAEREIRSNEQWVAGCRDMISKGVPSPLDEALAHVAKSTAARDDARARLKARGYRARFRGPIGHADEQGPA